LTKKSLRKTLLFVVKTLCEFKELLHNSLITTQQNYKWIKI